MQQALGFPTGGYDKSASTGFYEPNFNASLGQFEPSKIYREASPFFPLGIRPAPTSGDFLNTPPGYMYNSTSGQFEREDSRLSEVNPFQPREFIKGVSACELELLSVCNSSSIALRPASSHLVFRKDWTLFVMASTGLPAAGHNSSSSLSFNYRYVFLNEADGHEEPVLSVTIRNDSVVFKNEKTGDTSIAGAPQCGPYCSTYPGGFFTFWLTYNDNSKKYSVSVNSNKEHLVEVSGYRSVFNKVRGESEGSTEHRTETTYTLWQLTNLVETPVRVSTTTTTTTSPPWNSVTYESCDLEVGIPCKGFSATIQGGLKLGNIVWITTKMHNGNIVLSSHGRDKYWLGMSLRSGASQGLISLLFNETMITLVDETLGYGAHGGASLEQVWCLPSERALQLLAGLPVPPGVPGLADSPTPRQQKTGLQLPALGELPLPQQHSLRGLQHLLALQGLRLQLHGLLGPDPDESLQQAASRAELGHRVGDLGDQGQQRDLGQRAGAPGPPQRVLREQRSGGRAGNLLLQQQSGSAGSQARRGLQWAVPPRRDPQIWRSCPLDSVSRCDPDALPQHQGQEQEQTPFGLRHFLWQPPHSGTLHLPQRVRPSNVQVHAGPEQHP
ncbi:hypothetical protein OIY81_3638, partial [Cryptosporidium canis]